MTKWKQSDRMREESLAVTNLQRIITWIFTELYFSEFQLFTSLIHSLSALSASFSAAAGSCFQRKSSKNPTEHHLLGTKQQTDSVSD